MALALLRVLGGFRMRAAWLSGSWDRKGKGANRGHPRVFFWINKGGSAKPTVVLRPL
jgi:hypothetical protein